MAKLRIGSRGSQLAVWQANHVAELLRKQGHEVSIEIIKTTGDKITEVALSRVGTKGMFTKEIEEALAEGRVDLAVHSLKDLPTELSREFTLAAILPREDARDAFVSVRYDSLQELPQGAHVGTSSLRREAQLKRLRRDLRVSPLRGNVDTRLRKLESGEFDAVILASAGLKRLGREQAIKEYLMVEHMCPAAGQGALAIETRANDTQNIEAVRFLDDSATRTTTTCERALLQALGGGCQVPIGAHASLLDGKIRLDVVIGLPSGNDPFLRTWFTDTDPNLLARTAAYMLRDNGADQILEQVFSKNAPAPEQP